MHLCIPCDRFFGSESALEQHQRDAVVHAETFRCETCDCGYSSVKGLEQHLKDSPAHTETFDCKTCKRSFSSEKALGQHLEDAPVHAETFNCKPCNRSFGTKQALEQHSRDSPNHRENPEIPGVLSLETISSLRDRSSLTPIARVREHKSQRSHQATSDHAQDVTSMPNKPTLILKESLRAFASPDQDPSTTQFKGNRASKPERLHEKKTSFMFPALHQSVADAVAPEIASTWFYENDSDDNLEHEYQTSVMGKFTCTSKACRTQQWNSKVVAILIRGYARNGYSAVVFNQRCRACDRLGTFTLDETSYVERIAYRLRVWADVPVVQTVYVFMKRLPHESEFCEGCKRGVCRQNPVSAAYSTKRGQFRER
ncbi:hypothetical protein P153DRAFT_328234 [Dothidotthia symphoricarpi CBS 119687]|uniref:C2H2-type domain-containing protein n=1 Tax=Dothidotthia symphoricarpi CBS 119687 TaxID=1392245 RepID=A0A6A5ZWW0_9PLEO|nr:uncharacterized protein P153DRAFT_328234 [Dothidotthia symphoricarpi CBS 119687]KAF2123424.1 hypothetical protein P153DRAFT_328234 [Dothidotthia symphoricarpi CBS 119687]